MELEILLISLLVAVITGIALNGFMDVIDRRAAHRINSAEEPARKLSARAEEQVGGWLERLVPGYVRRIRSDLYWATLADSRLQNRSAAAVFGRQVLLTAGVGMAGYLALGSTIALAGGLFIGWTLASTDLHAKAETIRLRIAQELPEFVQLMAAESASGAGLSRSAPAGCRRHQHDRRLAARRAQPGRREIAFFGQRTDRVPARRRRGKRACRV